MNQKTKIIAPSKNTFQNMGGFLKLLPQKIHFRHGWVFKIAPSKNIFQNMGDLKLLPENVFSKLSLKICIIGKIVF